MKNWMLVIGLGMLLFAGCQKDNGALDMPEPDQKMLVPTNGEFLDLRRPFQEVRVGEPFSLRVNEVALVLPDRIRVTFMDVTEDSRCPSSATCVWEGRATIKFSFEQYDDYFIGELATRNSMPLPGSEMSVFGRNAKLLDVAPYPTGRRPIPLETYRVTMVFGRSGGAVTF